MEISQAIECVRKEQEQAIKILQDNGYKCIEGHDSVGVGWYGNNDVWLSFRLDIECHYEANLSLDDDGSGIKPSIQPQSGQ